MTPSIRSGLALVGREHRGRWAWLLVVAVAASVVELVGAAMVYLLLALVADPGGELALPVVGDVRELFAGVDERRLQLGLATAMGVFFLLRAATQVGQAHLQSRVSQQAGAELSHQLVRGYLSMPYAFHLHRSSSELIRNAHSSVQALVEFVLLPVVRISAEAILVVALVALLATIAPWATLLAVGVVGSASLLLLRVIQPRLQLLGWTAHDLDRETLGALQQALEGQRDIRVLGREQDFADAYGAWRHELARVRYRHATAAALPRTVIELALIGLVLVVFVVAVGTRGTAAGTVSVLGLFAYAGLRLQPSLQRIVAALNNLKFAQAPLETLHEDFRLIAEQAHVGERAAPIPFEQALVLDDVGLRYEGADTFAVRGIDLVIAPGEVIGVCGPTGGGKSTLVDLVIGLLPPTEGRVTVDGRDLREHARGWQQNLGVVHQRIFLVDDTIRRNIAFGLADEDVDEDAVTRAVRLAQLEDFVGGLPNGLDTVVGERGVRLSGGERQRVAIARALYREPTVLVLDEGTSALDMTTEVELLGAIERLREDHTIIMVAHRLSTVRGCDRIVYVEGGRIAGLDTFEALATSNPAFRRMAAEH